MGHRQPSAKINVKTLVILACIVIVLGVGAFTARHVRRNIIKRDALAAGQAALEKQDWATASEQLRRYLERAPDDIEILQKYGEVCLEVRPRTPETVGAAIGAYRRLLREAPEIMSTYDKLAELYSATRNMNELAYIANKCLKEQDPNHLNAPLWLATSLVTQRKLNEAHNILEQFIDRLEAAHQNGELHYEYIDACAILCAIDDQSDSARVQEGAIKWLDQAVLYDPRSATALLHRARYHRLNAADPTQMGPAIEDLEAADTLHPTDPRDLLALCGEWMAHHQYEQAWAELQLMKAIDDDAVTQRFSDLDDWQVSLCLIEADLLLRTGAPPQRRALADAIMNGDRRFEYDQHRIMALPAVIKLYLADDRPAEADSALAKYVELTALLPANQKNDEKVALLRALIAQANDRPYQVIELLRQYLTQPPSDPAILKLLANAFTNTGQNRRAAKVLEQYLASVNPLEAPEATLQLANQRLRNGDFQGAARLAAALGTHSINAVLTDIEAQLRLAETRGPTALREAINQVSQTLENRHKAQPDHTAIYIIQSEVAEYQKDLEAAEQLLKQAIEHGDDPKLAETALADFYLRHKLNDQARQTCREICEKQGDQADSWINLAKVFDLDAQYNQERETLLEGLREASDEAELGKIKFQLAVFELIHGQRQAGIDYAIALKDEEPQNLRVRALLLDLPETLADPLAAQTLIDEIKAVEGEAGLLWRVHQAALWLADKNWKSNVEQIRTLLQTCIAADPGLPAAVILMGQLYTRLEQFDQAEQLYEQALVANPMAAGVADRLLALLQKQTRYDDARVVLERLNARIANRPGQRLQVLLRSGDFDAAVDELKLKIAGNPQDANSRILLADLLYQQTGDAAQALEYLDQVEHTPGESIPATDVRARILLAEKRTDELLDLLDATVERHDSFEAYHLRGGMLAQLGRTEPAEADFIRLTQFEDKPLGYAILESFYVANGRLDDAIAALEQGLNRYPDQEDLKIYLMQNLLDRSQPGDRDRGLKMLSELTAQREDDPRLLMVQALLAIEKGRPADLADAERLLTRIIKLNPADVRAHLKLIGLILRQGKLEAANTLAVSALDANSNNQTLMLARAEIENELGNRSTASMLVRNVIMQNPNNYDAVNVLAGFAIAGHNQSELQEARRELDRAIKAGLQDPNLRINRAFVLAGLDDLTQALSSLDGVLEVAPKFDPARLELLKAQICTANNDLEQAGQHLAKAAELAPNNNDVLWNQIENCDAKAEYDAIVDLVAGDTPLKPELLIRAAAGLLKSQNPAHATRALDLLEQALSHLTPDSPDYLNVAALFHQAGQFERAAEIYRTVLSNDPDNPRALNDWAWILAKEQKQYEQALELALRGLANAQSAQLKTLRLNLLDTIGVILTDLTRYDEAKRKFQDYYDLAGRGNPLQAKALLQLGRVCAKSNDKANTTKYLNEALEIDKTHAVFNSAEREEIASLLEQANAAAIQ